MTERGHNPLIWLRRQLGWWRRAPVAPLSLEQTMRQTPVQIIEHLLNSWRGRAPRGLSPRVLDAVARDPRCRVRERAAALLGEVVARDPGALGAHAESLLAELVADPISVVRATANAAVARLLEGLHGARRARLIGDWATAPSPRVRAAVAPALPRAPAAVDPDSRRKRARRRRRPPEPEVGEQLYPR